MHRVITIARQYGSRGREIGRAVAELTGSKFYDNNLITMSAQKTGISSDKLVDADEKIPNSVLYTLATGSSIFANTISPSIQPINDRLFFAQSDLIKSLAAQGPSVFVGRCADSVLEGREHILRVFFYADFTHRVNEICKRHSLSESEAKSIIIKTDRHRANYYNYYTGRKWGKPENYDLMLATDRLTTEQAAQCADYYIRHKYWGKKRIAMELISRGYGRKTVSEAIATISDALFEATIVKLVEKKYPEPAEDRAEHERRISAISRMGYSLSEIKKAMSAVYGENF